MIDCVTQYYRCPESYIRFASKEPLGPRSGYFQFGKGATCYGSYCGHQPAPDPTGPLHDALRDVVIEGGRTYLPFNPSQVVENLRRETYVGDWRQGKFSVGFGKNVLFYASGSFGRCAKTFAEVSSERLGQNVISAVASRLFSGQPT